MDSGPRLDGFMMLHDKAQKLPILLFALFSSLAVVLPFSDKAFHIDDTFYLEVSKQIVRDPLRPYSFTIDWGERPNRAFEEDNNPPLYCYWTALALAVFGERELPLHLAILPFTALAIGSMFWLSAKFQGSPVIPTLTFAFSPAFIPSHNVMLDVPLIGLTLAAIACFVSGVDSGLRKRLALAGCLTGLAILTKYSALVLLPLLLSYALIRRRFSAAWFLLIPVAMLALWGLHGWLIYGRPHFVGRGPGAQGPDLAILGQASCRSLAGCAFPALLLIGLKWTWPRVAAGIAALAISLTAGWPWAGPFPQHLLETMFVLNLGSILLVLVWTGWEVFQKRGWKIANMDSSGDTVFLLFWTYSFPLFNLLFSSFVSVRHLLPALPPILILALRCFEEQGREAAGRARLARLAMLGVTALFGFLVASADREYAEVYREAAPEIARAVRTGDEPAWFVGHWGWQYYAAAAGLTPFNIDQPPLPPESVLALPAWVPRQRPEVRQDFRDILHIGYPARSLLRTVSKNAHYYQVTQGMVAYEFSSDPLEEFVIYRAK